MTGVAILQEKTQKIISGVLQLSSKSFFEFVCIFQRGCRAENGVNIKNGFAEFFQFGHLVFAQIQDVYGQEGIAIHFVSVVQICIEPVVYTVGQNCKFGRCCAEIAEQLGIVPGQIFRNGFAFDQNHGIPVLHNCVIYLFTFFDSDICGEFRYELLWVEHIIPQHGKERHDQCRFRCFLGLNGVFHRVYAFGKLLQLINEIHNTHALFLFFIFTALRRRFHAFPYFHARSIS